MSGVLTGARIGHHKLDGSPHGTVVMPRIRDEADEKTAVAINGEDPLVPAANQFTYSMTPCLRQISNVLSIGRASQKRPSLPLIAFSIACRA